MKLSRFILLSLIFSSVACSQVKTRQEAAEDAKLKTLYRIENPPVGPIDEEEDTGTTSAPVSSAADDQILNDELAAMGIDPSNPDRRKPEGTPEPEVHGNVVPQVEPAVPRAAPVRSAPVKKAAAKKAPAKKKPVKKTKKKKPAAE